MFEKIRNLLRRKPDDGRTPDQVKVDDHAQSILASVKNPREKLLVLKETYQRDLGRRREAEGKLRDLIEEEAEIMKSVEKGTPTANQKLQAARDIKDLRYRMHEYKHKIDNIYAPRMKVVNENIASLSTFLEVKNEPLPSRERLEEAAIKARNMTEDLAEKHEVAAAISVPPVRNLDTEEENILGEMKQRAAAEEERKKEVRQKKQDAKEKLEDEHVEGFEKGLKEGREAAEEDEESEEEDEEGRPRKKSGRNNKGQFRKKPSPKKAKVAEKDYE